MTLIWLVVAVTIAVIIATFLLTVIFGAPYVPSLHGGLEQTFTKLYKLTKSDLLVDVGSGDGVVLRHAAKKGARAVGYEINPFLCLISKILCHSDRKIKIYLRNFLLSDLPADTTVVYIFGVEHLMPKIYVKLKQFAIDQKRSVYLISLGFEVKNHKPIRQSGAAFLYKIDQ